MEVYQRKQAEAESIQWKAYYHRWVWHLSNKNWCSANFSTPQHLMHLQQCTCAHCINILRYCTFLGPYRVSVS